MFLVVGHLLRPSSGGFFDGGGHALGHLIRVHDDPAIHVPGGASRRLGQAAVASQKSFFVGIHDGHQTDFWKVESFSKEVHPDQHVECTVPQFPQNFHPVQRFDVRVDVPGGNAQAVEVFGQFFGHSLGERGDQDAFLLGNGCPNFSHEVVHLVFARPDLNGWVQEPSRPDDLLHHDAFGAFELKVCWGGADVDALVDDAFEFLKGQWPVV